MSALGLEDGLAKLVVGQNDLASRCPEVAAEWDYEKNGDVTPEMVSYGSNVKYWWKCSACGTSFMTRVSTRTRGSNGCPECRYKTVAEKVSRPKAGRSLADLFPDVATEWSEQNDCGPNDVYAMARKKAIWECSTCGHVWKAAIYSRTAGCKGCPECGKATRGNSQHTVLSVEQPELANEWDYEKNGILTPDAVTSGSEQRVWWLCKDYGHSFAAKVKSRTHGGTGCPYCAGQEVLVGFNDLASKHPDIAAQWHPTMNGELTPRDVTCGSSRKVWWTCCNHDSPVDWQATVASRAKRGTGCPACAINRSSSMRSKPADGESLADLRPDIAAEWHPVKNGELTPNDVMPHSSKRVWWICSNGHEWQNSVASRVNQESGCAVCSGLRLEQGVNDLETLNPDLAAEWHPTKNGDLTPRDVTAGNKMSVWWLGSCGHEWSAPVGNRHSLKSGCPECRHQSRVSFPEKAIYYYVLREFPDALENETPDADVFGRMELDIYIPSIRTGIEYDGAYWHNNDARDLKKDEACEVSSIRLIRVREAGCENYSGTYPTLILRDGVADSQSLNTAINELMALLGRTDAHVDVDEDEAKIDELLRRANVANSVASYSPYLVSEWHPTRNGSLTPYMLKPFSSKKVWWQCAYGHEWQTTVASRSQGSGCPVCAYEVRLKMRARPTEGTGSVWQNITVGVQLKLDI